MPAHGNLNRRRVNLDPATSMMAAQKQCPHDLLPGVSGESSKMPASTNKAKDTKKVYPKRKKVLPVTAGLQKPKASEIFLNGSDSEKKKLIQQIQQQLVLLIHAYKCQRREQTDGEAHTCEIPHCRTMKNVRCHMTTCKAGKSCQSPHCASSRRILSHWKNCTRDGCHICSPLRLRPTENKTKLFAGYTYKPVQHVPQVELSSTLDTLMNDRPNNTPLFTCQCLPSKATKQWHQNITQDVRDRLIYRIIQAILPEQYPASVVNDRRTSNLVAYAAKVEKDMYENANDREGYYHLIAEKIYKVRRELAGKRQERMWNSGLTHSTPIGCPNPSSSMFQRHHPASAPCRKRPAEDVMVGKGKGKGKRSKLQKE